MESTFESLEYQPLEARRIRLFGVDPGGPDDEITGVLVEQDLDALDHQSRPFSALSYIWGDAIHETATIVVKNDATGQTGALTITRTLRNALRNFRSPLGETWVWVDQICIDQNNDKEKGAQILLLRLIYQRANWVVAQLENHEESDLAMSLLSEDEWSKIVPFSKALDTALERIGQESTPINRTKAFRAIASLLVQRYWKRTWIWQEVTAKPDDCLIRFGTKQVKLRNVMVYIFSYKQYMTNDVAKDKDWDEQPIWNMTPFIDFWVARRLGRESSLMALLDEVRDAEITDPRDKVFAVLPFSSDAAQDFELAYHRSTHEAYTKFALWQMVKYQSLDVVTFSKGDFGRFLVRTTLGRITTTVGGPHVSHDTETDDDFEDYMLATWVPDWRARSPTWKADEWKAILTVRPLPKAEHIYDPALPRLYKASGSVPPAFRFTFPDTQTFVNGLTVHAVKVASIGHVQRDRMPATLSLEVEEDWHREFKAANISNWDYTGDHLFKRTIYADVTFRAVDNIIRYARSKSPDLELMWPNVTQVDDPFLQLGCLKRITRNRAPFRTKVTSEKTTGLYGLGPIWARPGDEIWILKGASVPFVLRRGVWRLKSASPNANLITGSVENVTYQAGDVNFTFVGECFVLGLMDGEVSELMQLDEGDSRRGQVPELEQDFHPITLF